MYASLRSAALEGLHVHDIEIEVSTGRGLPGMVMVGLPGKAVTESRDRVKSALQHSDIPYPRSKITVNLAPGDLKKEGPLYDLPIAVGTMICMEFLKVNIDLAQVIIVGELSLSGQCRSVPGILSIAEFCQQRKLSLICPVNNYAEARLVPDLEVYPIHHLNEVAQIISGRITRQQLIKDLPQQCSAPHQATQLDFVDVKGQELAKRAMVIAAAGRHNLIMVGPPGSGKSMLAQRFPALLPPLSPNEALQVTKIHSVAGQLGHHPDLLKERPFRAPHHSISEAALIGGGNDARPGEISLCHRGVLFLDELPEFKRNTLELLRQPMESGEIHINRCRNACHYPAQFALIAAMNPCPCGYSGSRVRSCRCRSGAVERYVSKLSGPLLDRIDMHVEVNDQPPKLMRSSHAPSSSTADMLAQIERASFQQRHRYGNDNRFNGDLRGPDVLEHCQIDIKTESFLIQGMEQMGFSNRAFNKVLVVARTIADLGDSPRILIDHISEALNYRTLDRNDPFN